MGTCTVRWRASGGRGEYEVVPAQSLVGRSIFVRLAALGVTIPAEVIATISQGKPRLRKLEPNNRNKLHLVPLVMALARLPEPAREDKLREVVWPLENKNFLVSHMDFEILECNDERAVLSPLVARILHSHEAIDLQERFSHIKSDIDEIDKLVGHPELSGAISAHGGAVRSAVNSRAIRDTADLAIEQQTKIFGSTNVAALSTIRRLPPSPFEDDLEVISGIQGVEGRIRTRLHSYRERDRGLVKKAKQLFEKSHGRLFCECCGLEPGAFYGDRGKSRVDAHHRVPVEELLPDSLTTVEDLAMVCSSCHSIIHAKRPWITVDLLREELLRRGMHYFNHPWPAPVASE